MTTTLRRILAVLSCCLPVAAQTPEERAEAVQEFKRYFRKFKETGQQIEAIRTLEGMESAAAVDELVRLIDHKDRDVAAAAQKVLGEYREPASFQSHIDALASMGAEAKLGLVRVLGRAGIRTAAPAIVAVATEKGAPTGLRYEAARSLVAFGDSEQATGLIADWFGDRDPLIRMAAAETVGALRLKPLGTGVIPLLQDGAWQVQSAAVAALASVREAAAVLPLIDVMAAGGRLEEECADALFRITGVDLGTDVDSWRSTWDRLTSIEGWRIPTDEEIAKAAASRRRYDAIYGKRPDSTPTFGGIPTTSTRILFIIDVSGSMADLVVEREKFGSDYADWQRLTIVKSELVNTIESLGQDVIFNVVAFATDVSPWKRNPVQANIVNRRSAIDWVQRLRPIGGIDDPMGSPSAGTMEQGKTNTFKALMYAFGVDPDARRPVEAESRALSNPFDTVFFLSDGRPTIGKYTDVQHIVDEVTAINQRFKMVFHTIAIGHFQAEFLHTLAEMNGGVFVDLGQ